MAEKKHARSTTELVIRYLHFRTMPDSVYIDPRQRETQVAHGGEMDERFWRLSIQTAAETMLNPPATPLAPVRGRWEDLAHAWPAEKHDSAHSALRTCYELTVVLPLWQTGCPGILADDERQRLQQFDSLCEMHWLIEAETETGVIVGVAFGSFKVRRTRRIEGFYAHWVEVEAARIVAGGASVRTHQLHTAKSGDYVPRGSQSP
ncbi:hypothetical protein B0H19DRAFT_1069938 [Mycena capillaripes]|nr:hypothetical protein B0H19DRAFT_1069938 [Mycena capillaripes]